VMSKLKRSVILVEDDASVLRAVRRLIVGAGFEVQAFERPSAVLKSAIPATNACLLIDVHLPEMNGVELCKLLAASGCELPVVIMTGAADEATWRLTRQVKAVAVLYKPFERSLLLAAIAKAFTADKKPQK
jgi:two-component system, LuxR family, response regulator FixJ